MQLIQSWTKLNLFPDVSVWGIIARSAQLRYPSLLSLSRHLLLLFRSLNLFFFLFFSQKRAGYSLDQGIELTATNTHRQAAPYRLYLLGLRVASQ
jgi:hypothetical protein